MHSCIQFTLIETLTELLLTLISSKSSLAEPPSMVIRQEDVSAVGSTDAFLASRLQYTKDAKGQEICLLKLDDGEQVGVMMGWEREISKQCNVCPTMCVSHTTVSSAQNGRRTLLESPETGYTKGP